MTPALAFTRPPAGLDIQADGRAVVIEIPKRETKPVAPGPNASLGRGVGFLLVGFVSVVGRLCNVSEETIAELFLGLVVVIVIGLIVWLVAEYTKPPETVFTLRVSEDMLHIIERKNGQIVRHERMEGRELLGVSVGEGPVLNVRSTKRPMLQIPMNDKTTLDVSWLARAINACCIARS